jgi:hypothetical protein
MQLEETRVLTNHALWITDLLTNYCHCYRWRSQRHLLANIALAVAHQLAH